MSRFDYLKNQSDEEEPKNFEKIRKKTKPYDDGTSRQKRDNKRRISKRKR